MRIHQSKAKAALQIPIYVTLSKGTNELMEPIGRTCWGQAVDAAGKLGGIIANYQSLSRKAKLPKLTEVIKGPTSTDAHRAIMRKRTTEARATKSATPTIYV